MATVFWCSAASILRGPDTWRTRGQYSNTSVYIYIDTKRGCDKIPAGKIYLRKELQNSKHKIAYTVKLISVHV
jgi:hypothetical protein